MATPAVTVLMPVHNGAAHLQEAIDSILGQTLPDFEFLIVDDGSTDQTPALLRAAARQDRRRRVLSFASAQGIVEALNAGQAEAGASLIARMDADDRSRPERLERQYAVLALSPRMVAVGSQIDTFGLVRRHLSYPCSGAETRAYLPFACPFKHPSVVMRRAALRQVGGYRHEDFPSEDYGLWLRLSQVGELANLPQTLLDYRLHGTSVTATRAAAVQHSNRRVLLEALALLGLRPDASELLAHEALGRAAFHPVRVMGDTRRCAEIWTLRLEAACWRTRWAEPEHLASEYRRRLANLVTTPG